MNYELGIMIKQPLKLNKYQTNYMFYIPNS